MKRDSVSGAQDGSPEQEHARRWNRKREASTRNRQPENWIAKGLEENRDG